MPIEKPLYSDMPREALLKECYRLWELLNNPHNHDFLIGSVIEAGHQIDRWGTSHDRGKTPADWFWLVGYLAGKALHAQNMGDADKAKHHTISTAGALSNWHASIAGIDTRMRPGLSDLQQRIADAFGVQQVACDRPPAGWTCPRGAGHEGPCAASMTAEGPTNEC